MSWSMVVRFGSEWRKGVIVISWLSCTIKVGMIGCILAMYF